MKSLWLFDFVFSLTLEDMTGKVLRKFGDYFVKDEQSGRDIYIANAEIADKLLGKRVEFSLLSGGIAHLSGRYYEKTSGVGAYAQHREAQI